MYELRSQRIVHVCKWWLTILFDIFNTVFVGREKSRESEREQQKILKAEKNEECWSTIIIYSLLYFHLIKTELISFKDTLY